MDYELLLAQASALIEGIPYRTANLANISALIYDSLEDVNWAGFYLLDGEKLVLDAFQGKPACVILPPGKGVCQQAIRENKSVNVPDVHLFPGHIACDCASRSELVLPIRKAGKPVAVLDIDSPVPNRFGKDDQSRLEKLANLIETEINF